jgi:DNA-binding response OmpR family regulator
VSDAVLLMEDDDDIRETLRFLLEEAHYAVIEAPNGLVGLALLRASRQRLIVLVDYRMPKLDGISVLREVAADRLLARHVYLLVTANYDQLPPGTAEILDALAVRTLRKPFDVDAVLAAVHSAQSRLTRSSPGPTNNSHAAHEATDHNQPAQEGWL